MKFSIDVGEVKKHRIECDFNHWPGRVVKMKTKTRLAGLPCGRPDHQATSRHAAQAAFTLVETMVATFIAAIVLPTLFAGLASGFWLIQAAREDSRATQVILQRMEAIRLSPYKSLQDPSAYPTNVVEYYSESGKTNGQGGAAYKVAYNWAPAPASLPPSYRTNVLLVSVTASWKTGDLERSRSMQTYVARYGIRRYVCGN